jgi:hypothetical protein
MSAEENKRLVKRYWLEVVNEKKLDVIDKIFAPNYVLQAMSWSPWRITRRFNFITGILGLNAIVRGLLAFWFVDGALYAFKDTIGSILMALVFGGSLLAGRPLLGAFVAQVLDPRTPGQEASLERLFSERHVAKILLVSTAMVASLNAVTALINFLLNLWIVTFLAHSASWCCRA